MAIQVSTLKTRFGEMKSDITDVTNPLFATWANYINHFCYRHLSGTNPDRFIALQTYSSVTTGTQTLPSDFKSMEMDGCGLYEVDASGNDTMNILPQLGFGSSSIGYYLNSSGEIQFMNVVNPTTYKLRYLPTLTEITTASQYFTLDGTSTGAVIIPAEYMLFLVNFASTIYDQWDEDLDLESIDDFRFVRTLDEISRRYRRTPETYSLDANYNAY